MMESHAETIGELSERARRLFQYMASKVTSNGLYRGKRAEMAEALGFSQATLTRALRELKELGLLEVVEPGGGAGKPTVYWLNSQRFAELEGLSPSSGEEAGLVGEGLGSAEHVQEHVPGLWELGLVCGGKAVEFIAGAIEGAVEEFLALPKWTQMATLGLVGAGVGLMIAELMEGERVLCGLGGALAGMGLAALVPSRERPAPAACAYMTTDCSMPVYRPAKAPGTSL